MLEFLLYALLHQEPIQYAPEQQDLLPQIEAFSPAPIPQKTVTQIAPKLIEDPRTALLSIDLGSGKTLFSKQHDRPQNIASITKLMTVLIILEEHDMDEVVTVTKEATNAVGSGIDIYEYERLTVETLLEATLIGSANDAAVALAVHNAGSEDAFAEKMNLKAEELGLTSAQFYNATGLDNYPEEPTDPVIGNVMSANDIARLSQILLYDSFVRNTVSKPIFSGSSVDESFYHEKETTNQLIGSFLGIKGLKTGYTQLAGQCFVALGETADGNEVLTIILGSDDRFGETKNLLSWIYDSFEW